MVKKLANQLLTEFCEVVGFELVLPADYEEVFNRLCTHLERQQLRTAPERRRWLIANINRKFRFNSDGTARLYAEAANIGYTFNYHQKTAIKLAFDRTDKVGLTEVCTAKCLPNDVTRHLQTLFKPVDEHETLRRFRDEVAEPSKLRQEKGERLVDREILLAAFSAYLFSVCEPEVLHQFFDKTYSAGSYEPSFWLQLRRMYPQLYNRNRTLDVLLLNQETSASSYAELRAQVLALVEESYRELNNHGHLAVVLDPIKIAGRFVNWELASDIILFGEKHVEVELKNAYFQPSKIRAITTAYVNGVDLDKAKFHIANEGFSYRDTFVLTPSNGAAMDTAQLLVILQKNERDETLIPCPACRTHAVQGNSYPALGVRSWECTNVLCPDRSKYNRGKRYSFRALLMQEAIDDECHEIPANSVKSWVRDVQVGRTKAEILEMLIRHYSLTGDTVHLFGLGAGPLTQELGRTIQTHGCERVTTDPHRFDAFFEGPFFQRYITPKPRVMGREQNTATTKGLMTIVEDDCFAFLSAEPPLSFDGAVTSPPYYNARDYAQWDNIYCYMHDIYNIGLQLHQTLRPGAVFLYNIFDYFDNERSVVFSAMGQKRMILSAYAVDAFRRAGFSCLGNVAWDKGDIEGKRGFNAGNYSPYYQAPFNCWEHILVFQKPGERGTLAVLPAILPAKPVMKMFRGENTYGHTAPYPEEIPALLARFVPAGGRVVDPFGGSGTTARALAPYGISTVCVERDHTYCELALEMGPGVPESPRNGGDRAARISQFQPQLPGLSGDEEAPLNRPDSPRK